MISSVRILLAGVVLATAASSARAATDFSVPIPCNLPSDAVRALPAVFDTYMALDCTQAGQVLRPLPGYQWVFVALDNITMWLSSARPDGSDIAPSTHFTRLDAVALSAEQRAAFIAEMHKRFDSPMIDQAQIVKMAEETSGGMHRQIYLLIPAGPTGAPVLGIECLDDCIPMEDKPWAFIIVPEDKT